MNNSLSQLIEGMLPKESVAFLTNVLPSIKKDFENKTVFRTFTEAKISVLNELHFPSPHMKYWQSVQEQQVHYDQLIRLSFDYRKLIVKQKKAERRLGEENDELKKELLIIKIESYDYDIVCAQKIAVERVREIRQWDTIKRGLLDEFHEQIDINTPDPQGELLQLKGYTKAFILEMFNSGNNIAAADAQNIIGKAITAKTRCRQLGVWDAIVSEMGLTLTQLKSLGE